MPKISNDTSVKLPDALNPHKDVKTWCLTTFILEGVQLANGLKSGPYRNFGKVSDMGVCMEKCCNTSDCTTAYLDGVTCYGIRCLDKSSCEVKLASVGQKVGYTLRNGWSLFSNQSDAMKHAAAEQEQHIHLENEDSLKEPNLISLTPGSLNGDISSNIMDHTFNGQCSKKEILFDQRFTAGVKAGVFSEHGEVTEFDSCIKYCCKDTSCNVAYMVDKTCFSVKCFNSKSCQTFSVPKFFLNPIIAFVERSGHVNDPDYGLKHHNFTVTLYDAKKPVSKHVHVSDHEHKKLKKPHQRKSYAHLSKGSRRHKQKQHQISGDKKLEVPTGALIQKLVHQIISDDGSGSGSSPIDIENSILETINGDHPKTIHHKHSKHRKHSHHKKHHKSLRRHHHKKKHRKHKIHHHTTASITTKKSTPKVTSKLSGDAASTSRHHYPLPLTDLDIDAIRALSPEQEYTSCNTNQTECEHLCINLLHGGYRCICRNGFQLALDGKHCLYQGVCNPKTFHCDHACAFHQNEVKCQCRSGFVMMRNHENKCKDMDECAMGIHGCSDICVNTPGSYICECGDGQKLAADRMTCVPIMESSATKKSFINRPEKRFTIPAMIVTAPNVTEVNQGRNILLQCKSQGEPTPKIVWTYGENSTSVIKKDPRYNIIPGGSLLIENAQVNDTGQYICISANTAGTDTTDINLRVNDIDECQENRHNCQQACINTYGSFKCSCYMGYRLMRDQASCQDVNECKEIQPCDHFCMNTEGSYQCSCFHGYRLDRKKRQCQDIDECIEKTHTCDHTCNNTIGSFLCTCEHGYKLSTIDNSTCTKMRNRSSHPKFAIKFATKNIIGLGTMVTAILATVAVSIFIAVSLYRKYKNRIDVGSETNTTNAAAPRITTRSSAIYSWD